MRLLNISCCGGCNHRKTSHLLWFLIFTQFLSHSSAFFFPMFSNFFSNAAFRNNNQNGNQFRGLAGIHEKLQQNTNGGVSIFSPSTASSNQSTSIRVPMFQRSLPNLQRRVDIVTTVINPAPSDVQQTSVPSDGNSTNTNGTAPQAANANHVEVHQNISTTFPDQTVQQTSQRLVIPTKTSVTSSITAIQNGLPVQVPGIGGGGIGLTGINRNPDSLTLPFTPNMFGILSFVQALKDIKRNYKDQEMERKMEFHNKQNGGGDLMTRILRTLIQKVVNKHQKHTEFLKLKIKKKEAKMQSFLQLPMVAQVIAYDEARAAGLTQPQPQVQQVAGVVAQPKSLQLPPQKSNQVHQHPHQHHQHPHHQHPHQQHQHSHQQHPHQHPHQQHQQHQNPHQQQHGLFGRRPGPLRNLLNSFLI